MGVTRVLDKLGQNLNCKCTVWPHYHNWPQDTSNSLCVRHTTHLHCLHRCWWSLFLHKMSSRLHCHAYWICIGKSEFIWHCLNISVLINWYSLCNLVSFNCKTKVPSHFTSICYFPMLTDFRLKFCNICCPFKCEGHIIHCHSNYGMFLSTFSVDYGVV